MSGDSSWTTHEFSRSCRCRPAMRNGVVCHRATRLPRWRVALWQAIEPLLEGVLRGFFGRMILGKDA